MKEERKPCLHAHVKWFYGQSERAYYLNYFIIARSSPIISFNLSIEKSHAFVNQPPLSSKKFHGCAGLTQTRDRDCLN